MKISDPARYFGIDSGLRTLTVTAREKATLLRAAEILERGHDVINAWNPDHQGDYEDLGDALCTAPPAIRRLVEEGIAL